MKYLKVKTCTAIGRRTIVISAKQYIKFGSVFFQLKAENVENTGTPLLRRFLLGWISNQDGFFEIEKTVLLSN